MRLSYRALRWSEVYQINASMGAIRFLMGLLFWVWGICGFALVAIKTSEVFSKLKDGVGVGSSSFLAALAIVWIGGMFFFGMGALIAASNFNVMQRADDEADPYGDVQITR